MIRSPVKPERSAATFAWHDVAWTDVASTAPRPAKPPTRPARNLNWFRPQPDADTNYRFPEGVQYLAATWCERIGKWSYAVGVFEPDGWGDWELIEHGGVATNLEEIDWLARLDCGKPDGHKTLFENAEGGK